MQDTVLVAEVAAPAVASDGGSDVGHMNHSHICYEMKKKKDC